MPAHSRYEPEPRGRSGAPVPVSVSHSHSSYRDRRSNHDLVKPPLAPQSQSGRSQPSMSQQSQAKDKFDPSSVLSRGGSGRRKTLGEM